MLADVEIKLGDRPSFQIPLCLRWDLPVDFRPVVVHISLGLVHDVTGNGAGLRPILLQENVT